MLSFQTRNNVAERTFNICDEEQFQKDLMNRLREKFRNVNFGPKNAGFYPILGKIIFFYLTLTSSKESDKK